MYPIIPHLCKEYEVDVLMFNQMSERTPWFGDADPRPEFYKQCKDWGGNVIQGPSSSSVKSGYKNGKKMSEHIRSNKYDLVVLDDNKTKAGWGTPSLCRLLRSRGHIVVGSPHGNFEFHLSNLDGKFNDILDFSFVFGNREKYNLASSKFRDRLIPAGIPANDCLKKYKVQSKHILVVVSFVDGHNDRKDNKYGYLPFNEDVFLKSGLLNLQQKYNTKILVKEKSKFKKGLSYSLKHLEKYDGVSVIMDHPDNNELVADSLFVVSAPSTLAFKPIQLGIPTVLIKNFGMVANYYDFCGLSDLDDKLIEEKIDFQVKNGKCSEFIKDTLTGGIDFGSTEIYLKKIREIIDGRRHF